MCSSFESIEDVKEFGGRFNHQSPTKIPGKKIKLPTDLAPVFDMEKKAHLLTWGIPQPWAEGKNARPIINARVETVAQKPTFQKILNRRCLVPATAWFEWRKIGCKKLKNRISMDYALPFTFAGLASDTHFTIITCEAVAPIAHIHKRMPLVLLPENESKWLNVQAPFGTVAKTLLPHEGYCLSFDEEKSTQLDMFN